MSAPSARDLARLDELTETRRAGQKAEEDAEKLVRKLLAQGATVAQLTGRPFSRAKIQNIRYEMKARGEIQ